MPEIYAQKLEGKRVADTNGAAIGYLQTITADFATGELKQLIIDPVEQPNRNIDDFRNDGEDVVRLPIEQVKAVRDYIVVEE